MITIDSDGFSPVRVTASPILEPGEVNWRIQVWDGDQLITQLALLTSMLGAADAAVRMHSEWFLRETNRPAAERSSSPRAG